MKPDANHPNGLWVCLRSSSKEYLMSLDFTGPAGPRSRHRQHLRSSPLTHSAGASAPLMVSVLSAVSVLAGCGGRAAGPPMAPPEVKVMAVAQRDVPIVSEWVATLDGYVNAQIQPQVAGYIRQTNL